MRDPASGWIQLSSTEFFLLWTALGLGEPPAALEVTHIGRTRESRATMAEEASRALADRDLGTVHEPADDLAGILHTLAAGDVTLDLRVVGSGSPLVGYAATDDRSAAVAARVDGEVRLGAVSASALAESLLGSISASPAGPGRPANVSAADYERACAEGDLDGVSGFARVLHEAGLRPADASVFATALTSRRGGGQLGATGRGYRSPSLVSWLDTDEGRYALRRHGSWITVTPADLPRLTGMAEEMVAEVRG
ncbi:ESX secretion-associated protein EspG [Actinophytocola sp.]|uniref:ESX secretion-associated protein EspG n=1 Tax=Actinophytocola sp. TaxID=1872138 RepID=UPI003D6ABFC3